jgi:hypothetical protein
MPNDAPDWSTVGSAPAIDLGAFSVPANTLATVYNGPTPPGCHSLKIYVQSTDPTDNAQQVTVIDGTTIHTIQQFLLPRTTGCVCALDDVSVPNVRVDVLANFAQASTGRVVAYLSDQAVTVDNDSSQPVPVSLITGNSSVPVAIVSTALGVRYPVALEILPFFLILEGASNARTILDIPAVVARQVRITTVTQWWAGVAPGGTLPLIAIYDGAFGGTILWVGAAYPPADGHWTFAVNNPVCASSFNQHMQVVLDAGGVAGCFGGISVTGFYL